MKIHEYNEMMRYLVKRPPEKYSKEALSLPIFPSLSLDERAKVTSALLHIFS